MDYEPLGWEKSLGYKVLPDRCRASVHNTYGVGFRQCNRKPLADSKYCSTHLPENVNARREASDRRNAEQAALKKKRDMSWHGAPFIEALRKIQAGHNDPRALAGEVLEKHGFATPTTTEQE